MKPVEVGGIVDILEMGEIFELVEILVVIGGVVDVTPTIGESIIDCAAGVSGCFFLMCSFKRLIDVNPDSQF